MSKNSKKMITARLISTHEELFVCPICAGKMKMNHLQSLVCSNNHCFDLSKSGYLNLYPRAVKSKYDQYLFASRRVICSSGFFEPLNAFISEKIIKQSDLGETRNRMSILDAGCGEGSHLSTIRKKVIQAADTDVLGVGVDLAKEGIHLASKEYMNMLWCVADIAKCPFAGNQFDVILNILSPSNYAEFRRMIGDHGIIIKVIPGRDYLQELRDVFYEKTNKRVYANDATLDRFKDHFQLLDLQRLRYQKSLDSGLTQHLIRMTPLSWGATEAQKHKVLEAAAMDITVDLSILIGKKPT